MPRPVRRRLGSRFRVQALGTRRRCLPSLALTSTVPSRSQSASAVPKALRPLPKRPPTLQAFRSVLSRTSLVSTRKRSTVPFHTPVATGFNSGEQEKYTIFSCRCAGESVSRSANRPISRATHTKHSAPIRESPRSSGQFGAECPTPRAKWRRSGRVGAECRTPRANSRMTLTDRKCH